MNPLLRLLRPLVLALAGLVCSCSLALDTKIGKGVGELCSAASDCNGQDATCEDGECTVSCVASDDCPTPSVCVAGLCSLSPGNPIGSACTVAKECSSRVCESNLCTAVCAADTDCTDGSRCVAQRCQRPLKAAFFFDGVVSNATYGFALTHEQGRVYAVDQLKWLSTDRSESNTTDTIGPEIDRTIREGADVIVVTTSRFSAEAREKAAANPTKKFLLFGDANPTTNVGGYFGRYHQAWYVAGVAAARATSLTTSKKIGFLGALAVPEVISQFNAFVLGVRSVEPDLSVEIVWANNFVPTDDVEKKMVDYLVAGGNEILVNRMGALNQTFLTNAATKQSATGGPIYTIALDNQDACKFAPSTCLGGPYWNWGPLYTRLLDSIHKGTWQPSFVFDSIQTDATTSTLQFSLNTAGIPSLQGIKEPLAKVVASLVNADGSDNTFKGPICPSQPDQRDGCVADGTTVSDPEINAMCWMVEGAVQRSTKEDPTSDLAPARVPDGTEVWPPLYVDPTAIDKPSCK